MDVLQVERREELGSAATRKLRRSGRVPAVLYGHGEQNEHLAVTEVDLQVLLRHHSKTVQLGGAVSDTALISDLQWDPLGIEVLHLDLLRVNLKEQVEVTVPLRLHGDAPGLREGGVLLENEHQVDIRCPAGAIPDQLEVVINDLHIGGQKTAADLALPEGVELVTPADTVIVHVEEARRPEEEVVAAEVGGEPEVIARGSEESAEE